MSWSLDEFFGGGGTTTFSDRLAASLGIHASTIKVVSVYTGSLVVNYEIAPTADQPISLEAVSKKQTEKFVSGGVNLGAPVLDVAAQPAPSMVEKAKTEGKTIETTPAKLVSDGQVIAAGYERTILVKTATNTNPDGCAKYSRKQSDGTCKSDTCTSTQRLLTLGSCEECGNYYTVSKNGLDCNLVDKCAATEILQTDGTCKACTGTAFPDGDLTLSGKTFKKECKELSQCNKLTSVVVNDKCLKCGLYTKPNTAGTGCASDTCTSRQRLNIDGTCKDCGDYTRANDAQGKECLSDVCDARFQLTVDGTC